MRKTFLLFSLCIVALLSFNSCEKDGGRPSTPNNNRSNNKQDDCEVKKYGTVRVVNLSSNPYRVFVGGNYITQLSGNTYTNIKVSEGNNKRLRAEQVSGYILYPTVRESTLSVVRCSEYQWQFP